MPDFESVLGSIASAPTRRALWNVVLDYLHSEGVKRVSYHAVDADASTMTIVTDGFPENWVRAYVRNNFVEIDPIPELAAKLAKPFYWHEIRDLVESTKARDAFLAAMDDAGLGDGLAFFVFGPGLQNAYVGLGFDVDRLALSDHTVFRLQCIAQAGHVRFCALNRDRPREKLSLRETEVLHWVAKGKSNSVIADLLRISPHTVDAHMRSIYRKLDVTDRTTAAIRGVGAGIVQYPHPAATG
ncbi:LuxR family transcriptional regulator [Thalassococcus sp. CAU 1522]|uniref:LuxR family transcriptional regulator n=1 Tax=Thalassococcus arenae TaxID=2851652 RepID=A0ABS6N4H8_9RHOB|nr:LuxR family transcriptional regulator [Thalassococcus arenae]MBV2358708.1 LuxR family transcriptional regulator [Thalassococcus arenae]